jgi:hypothetical protein
VTLVEKYASYKFSNLTDRVSMRILMLFIFAISINAWSMKKIKTMYQWRLIKENKLNSGKCFEVDAETEGSRYQNIVDDEKCRPEDFVYTFNYANGKCYEADNETVGKFYFNKTVIDNCRPKETYYLITKINNKTGCFEVDKETDGKKFYNSTKKTNCSENFNFLWVQRSETKGQCYKVSTSDPKARIRARLEDCRPEKTDFIFIRQTQFRGTCVEVHPKDPKLFTHKTDIENCKPKNTLFVFYREDEVSKGKCYEVDENTKGDEYLDSVKIENCKGL